MTAQKNNGIATILVIDDEKDILKSIRDTLANENFDVLTATGGKQGIEIARKVRPDIILLDLRMPDMDGYDVCRTLKATPETAPIPVIIVSTRAKETEKVVGLEMGADDYLTKPFNDLELLARIRVALRRRGGPAVQPAPPGRKGTEPPVLIDNESRKVFAFGKPVDLTRKEFDLLAFFVSRAGKAVSRITLLEAVWGSAVDSLQGTVDTHIKTLRKKLGPAGRLIETVPGIGYRWAEDEE